MPVRLRDLPPEVRQQVAAQHGVSADGRIRPKPPTAGAGDGRPCLGRCAGPHGCGQQFPTYKAWEKHATGPDRCHGRWEIQLDERTATS